MGPEIMSRLDTLLISTTDLAGLFSVSPQRVRDLAREGIIPRASSNGGNRGGGLYPFGESVRGYLAFVNRTPKTAGKDALIAEQTRKLRLENDTREAEICDTVAVIALADAMIGAVESEVADFPKRATKDRELRARLEREIDASVARIKVGMAAVLNEALVAGEIEED